MPGPRRDGGVRLRQYSCDVGLVAMATARAPDGDITKRLLMPFFGDKSPTVDLFSVTVHRAPSGFFWDFGTGERVRGGADRPQGEADQCLGGRPA